MRFLHWSSVRLISTWQARRNFKEMETDFSSWQALMLSSMLGWVVASSFFDLTKQLRSLIQPRVARRVLADTPFILRIQVSFVLCNFPFILKLRCSLLQLVQKLQHPVLDTFFSLVSCVVSVPFYTGFLPILFWVCLWFFSSYSHSHSV